MFMKNMNDRFASDMLLEESIFFRPWVSEQKWNLQSSAEQYVFYRANSILTVLAESMAD